VMMIMMIMMIIVSSTGEIFLSSVPDGVFNLVTSFNNLKEFVKIHEVIDSNKPSKAHWRHNLRMYAHHAEPLFDVFTPIEALRWEPETRRLEI